MKQVKSDEARRKFRDLLNLVEYQGESIEIFRYTKPAAVLVPSAWYREALLLSHLGAAHARTIREALKFAADNAPTDEAAEPYRRALAEVFDIKEQG